jgi:hypothetical protein
VVKKVNADAAYKLQHRMAAREFDQLGARRGSDRVLL